MDACLRMFKCLEIKETNSRQTANLYPEELMKKTVKQGFIFSPEIIATYPENDLLSRVKTIGDILGLNSKNYNTAFHKSWAVVRDSSMEDLIIDQIIHYVTTYGYERLGIYSDSTVYIPEEKLEAPKIKVDKLPLIVVRGYTKAEIKTKLLDLLKTGIALRDTTVKDIVDIGVYLDLSEEEIETCRNKEVKVALYDYLDKFPQNNVEFLRFLIYKSTNKKLLIKNKVVFTELKSKDNLPVLKLIKEYQKKYGLEKLAEIFYRFKPLFLGFRTNQALKTIINKIRKLAVKNHKPMPVDYLNSVTGVIKRFGAAGIDTDKLVKELSKVNIFRKIRLAYALKYRTKDAESILYRVRNGKSYVTKFDSGKSKAAYKDVLAVVMNSIVENIIPKVKDKKIFIPSFLRYALPISEKQFIEHVPEGTSITLEKDMVFGVHWEDQDYNRIDLDLSLISAKAGKIGWNGYYRGGNDESILFSGDMTSAPLPNGASEMFYIGAKNDEDFLVNLNYYNYKAEIPVPYKVFVSNQKASLMNKNYVVDPNKIVANLPSKIDKKQKIAGIVSSSKEGKVKFYFVDTVLGDKIASSANKQADQAKDFLMNYYKNSLSLNKLLKLAGAVLVETKEEADISLALEDLEKDTIINLLTK